MVTHTDSKGKRYLLVEYCDMCPHHRIKEEKHNIIFHACVHPKLPQDKVIPVEDYDEGLIPDYCPLPAEDVNVNPKYIFDPAKIVEQIERRINNES